MEIYRNGIQQRCAPIKAYKGEWRLLLLCRNETSACCLVGFLFFWENVQFGIVFVFLVLGGKKL